MNKKYSTLLVPHDGSEMSEKAVEESIKFAKVFGSEIILLYVVDERYAPPSSLLSFISDRTSLKEAKNELKRVLETGAQAMLDKTASMIKEEGIKSKITIRVGSPAKEIVETAKEMKCDIIIMGSRSLKSGRLRALGSVARRVAEIAPCEVMLVH
jgi:nucleotide-binding universal stress UspA family protein